MLILDCLRPILDATGLKEGNEAGVFLVAFDALLKQAGIAEAGIAHHMGHVGERFRGDSRLGDWPDAEWRLVRHDPDDPASPLLLRVWPGRRPARAAGQPRCDDRTSHHHGWQPEG
jgi:hypothetical protein